MNSTQVFDVFVCTLFGVIGLGAIVAIISGATHQWLSLAISAVVIVVAVCEYKSEKAKNIKK